MKMAHSASPSEMDETLQDQLLDAQDEISSLREERDALSARIAQLESERLSALQADASTSSSDKDARILELTKENQELLVIAKNADVEGELRRQERKFERALEKHRVYQEGLEATLEQERKVRREPSYHCSQTLCLCQILFSAQRVAQFERFILQHMVQQTDLLSGRRRSSVALSHSASIAGFQPLMAETADLNAISPDFVELDDLQVREITSA